MCFFMVYHDRPELTKMSVDDMSIAMNILRSRGHSAEGIVIGDNYNVAKFCEDRGIRHEMFANQPLSDKFVYAWIRALQQRTDYLCWYGSNNVHGAGYWEECCNVLDGNKQVTFGTMNCVIMSADPDLQETCVFRPLAPYLISSGQFFLRWTLMDTINFLTLYEDKQTFNFDGYLMNKLFEKWGRSIVKVVEYDEEDCIDVKNAINIHSYQSYIDRPHYKRHDLAKNIIPRHPALQLFFDGYYQCW